jgi:RNA polymerase sigma factor (sigma-70 family)
MAASQPDPPPTHDDDRFERLYRRCKATCVAYATRLLASSGRNRHLCAFEAEEFYDAAWETYYRRREYLAATDDHVARLNALVRDRVLDEWRRSQARKRSMPAHSLDPAGWEEVEGPVAPGHDQRLVDRDELHRLLARVRNPADARALVDHELRGLTFEEIGAREGIGAEAARRRAQRAAEQIRRLLGGDGRDRPGRRGGRPLRDDAAGGRRHD